MPLSVPVASVAGVDDTGTDDGSEHTVDDTGAVVLRPLADADLDALFDWMRHPEAVARAAFTMPDPDDRQAFDAWVERVRSTPSATVRAVEVAGAFVATIGSYDSADGRDVTYWVDPARWRTGVATAALRTFLRDEEHHRPLLARVAEHNVGSLKVLEHNGFRAVGRDRGFAAGVGREVDELLLRLDD